MRSLSIVLMNLLFLKKPKYYSEGDLDKYKKILSLSSLHEKCIKESVKDKTNGNKSKNNKLKNVIGPLFNRTGSSL